MLYTTALIICLVLLKLFGKTFRKEIGLTHAEAKTTVGITLILSFIPIVNLLVCLTLTIYSAILIICFIVHSRPVDKIIGFFLGKEKQ